MSGNTAVCWSDGIQTTRINPSQRPIVAIHIPVRTGLDRIAADKPPDRRIIIPVAKQLEAGIAVSLVLRRAGKPERVPLF